MSIRPTGAAEVRDLRGDIRHWRRGRADARLADVLEDVYIGLFAVLMFGAMLTNVVLNVARVSDDLCSSAACRSGRGALPWLVALATLALVAALARLFGPVFVTPASASWLLPAPVDRSAVLRPRLVLPLAAGLLAALLPAAVASGLAGFGAGTVAIFTIVTALLALTVVALLAHQQARAGPGPLPGRLVGGLLGWLLGTALWIGLVVLALGAAPVLATPERVGAGWWVALPAGLLLACGAGVAALRTLPRLRDRELTAGGRLAPNVSGALATLDLALLYDVVVGHRWRRRAAVVPRRAAAIGPAALVRTDLVRLRRSPQVVVVLAMGLAAPYAVAETGAGRVTLLVAAAVAFVAGLPLLVALRVLTRTPSLLRMLPFGVAETRRLVLRVPGVLLVGFGVLTTPALDRAVGGTATGLAAIGVAVGLAGLAAAVRWVTGRPPDYSRPLVSTPAGGVPTNLYGSVLRGFDMLLLTTAPLLLSPDGTGATFSLLLSLAVIGYLTGRE